ncbi:hypothetical protein [Desulfotalea psychrophila]|nr:hypothetical protein [Desulfotalea psychrophila]
MFVVFRNGENIEFADAEMSYLEELLNSIDTSLLSVTNKINSAGIQDVECLCDKGEYFIGVGFCAMQRYLFDTLMDIKLDAGLARELGPKSSNGVAVAQLIHSAANYWKHSPEWHIWLSELGSRSQNTVDKLLHGRESASYPLFDLLADLCNEDSLLLTKCLPYLIDWRLAIYEHVSNNI